MSPPDPMQHVPTVLKKTLELKELDLNLDVILSGAIAEQTGSRFGRMLRLVGSMTSRPTFSFAIIGRCVPSLQTMVLQLPANVLYECIMDPPVLVRAVALGRRPVRMHMLKIHVQNSGAATVVSRMLLLMNFEEVSVA